MPSPDPPSLNFRKCNYQKSGYYWQCWLGAQSMCVYGVGRSSALAQLILNFSGIPSFRIQSSDYSGLQTVTIQVAFLVCQPNANKETREVRTNSQDQLSIQPLPSLGKLSKQRNLDFAQCSPMPSQRSQTRVVLVTLLKLLFGSTLQASIIFDPQTLAKFNATNPATSATIHPH